MLSSLGRYRAELSRLELASISPQTCVLLVEELAKTEKACATLRAMAAAKAADAGAHRQSGFTDPADWLGRVSGTSCGEAGRELHAAKCLQDMPATRDAAAKGALSMRQVEEIAKTETQCPGSEREMLATATRETLRALQEKGRKKRQAAVRPEELARRQRDARSVRHWRDEIGMVCGTFSLVPEVGIPFVSRLDAETDREWRRGHRAGRPEPRERHAADALERMVAGRGKGNAARADVVFVCDVRAYQRGHAHAGESCHIAGAGPVPVGTIHDAMRDAFVKGVLHDGTKIDTVAHYGRHINAEIRTALELGEPPDFDGVVCCEPGCGRRFGLEFDHVDPRANHGETSLENLAPRCRPHHRDKSERDRQRGLWSARGP
ncbi:MAG: protein of unknown function endonuclease [Acidimicrobiales bacterium]|nr:protein of unknown function endonuclease [Acidimicrobiales bacterium]